jgi:hypothetical protein
MEKIMVDQKSTSTHERHVFTESGRDYTVKRKLSDKEESESKREKNKLQNSISSNSSSSTNVNEEVKPTMETGELLKAMKLVMLDIDISNSLVNKFKEGCDDRIVEKTGEIRNEIESVKAVQEQHKSKFESVETKIDNLEQENRMKNLLVRGINVEDKNFKQACITTLNKQLKLQLKTIDIKYALPIGKTEDQLIKLAFTDIKKREEVYKIQSKLKGKRLWITEDLTPRKAALSYKSRQCVKAGQAVLTWTHEGKNSSNFLNLQNP